MARTTKGGRVMNPTDAARKLARKREINRNKKERDLQRATPKEVPEINRRLEEVLAEEEAMKSAGRPITKDLHIRKKVLLDAMKLAVAKERENSMKELFGEEGVQTTPFGHGVPQRKPEDSVYYHPITNPTGMPPAGRPQRYKDDVELMDPAKAEKLEEERRVRAAAAAASAATQQTKDVPASSAPANILPPPPGPPPGFLAPPAGPPPGILPPPPGPPPGVPTQSGPPPGMLLPPAGPPPGIMPPPPGPPPGFLPRGPPLTAGIPGPAPTTTGVPQASPSKPASTVSVVAGEATAVRTIPAHQDPRLKAMVPATVRAKRQKVQSSKLQQVPNLDVNAGFGLAPVLGASDARDAGEAAYAEFMDEIARMG